jgi:hypothetical protein
VLGALVLPAGALTIYIECTRDLPYHTTDNGLDSDLPVLFACVALGAASMLTLPCRWRYRIVFAILVVPVLFFGLAFFWFIYEMGRTGGWI